MRKTRINSATITTASFGIHPLLRQCFITLTCAALVAGCGNDGPERARTKLAQLGITYSPSAFVKAARDGDLVAVKQFLKSGLNANTKMETEHGPATVLYGAVAGGNKEIVELLLEQGANVNAAAFGKDTPLHVALGRTNADLALVQLLLKHGANVDATREGGATPLMQAVIAGNLEAIDLLLSKGADVNAKETEGFTALIFAASDGSVPVVKALLKFKPELEAKAGLSRRTALETARARGYAAAVETLRAAGAVSVSEQYLSSLQGSHEDVLPSAVAGAAARVEDNAGDDTKSIEIMRAFYRGEIVEQWKKQGMSQRQLAAMLVSTVAAIYKGTVTVKMFSETADWAKDPRRSFVEKARAESWASFKEQVRSAAPADPSVINVCDAQRSTALMWAAMLGDTDFARWLVEQGADLKAQNNEGKRALDVAEGMESDELFTMLKTADEKKR